MNIIQSAVVMVYVIGPGALEELFQHLPGLGELVEVVEGGGARGQAGGGGEGGRGTASRQDALQHNTLFVRTQKMLCSNSFRTNSYYKYTAFLALAQGKKNYYNSQTDTKCTPNTNIMFELRV